MDEERIVAKKRTVPRPFSFHWGGGQIVEEATFASEWNEPTVQLLEYEDGSVTLRFCSYTHRGQFQRSPFMIDGKEMDALKAAIKQAPRLRALLKKMVD